MSLGGSIFVMVTLIAGWLILWPIRNGLGAAGANLAALPVGMLVWPLAAAAVSLCGLPFQGLAFACASLAVVAVMTAMSYVVRSRYGRGPHRVSPMTYVVWGVSILVTAVIAETTGITTAGYDSVFHYESWGVWLVDTGKMSTAIAGSYGLLQPAMHAVNRLFGSDWTAVPWPVLSVNLLAILSIAIYSSARSHVRRGNAVIITGGAVLLLATTVPYINHSIYVHSHMTSAIYLMLAIWSVFCAWSSGDDEASGARSSAWLLLVGFGAAGLALARVDGMAYSIIPISVAVVASLDRRIPLRRLRTMVAAFWVPLGLVYVVFLYRLHFWGGDKLTGKQAAVVLLGLAGVSALIVVLDRLIDWVPWLRDAGHVITLILGLELVAVIGALALAFDTARTALSNMVTNLFSTGGYGHLWWFVVAVLLISLVWRLRHAEEPWMGYLRFILAQFFMIAVLVHGVTHPGRLSPADSFARVSFHVLPLVFWYAGLHATGLVVEWGRRAMVREVP